MGNDHQKYESLQIQPDLWEKIDEMPTHELMRNINTRQQGQYYHFNISTDQKLDDQLEIYMYRAQTQDNVVKVLGVQSDEKGFGFCGSQMFIRVMTEKIIKKLCAIRNLNNRDQLTVLYNSLTGYSSIYKKYKGVKIASDMIGINEHGQIKVWVNQNFGMNKKIDLRHDCQAPENMMVRTIAELVENSSHQLPKQIRNNILHSSTLYQAAGIVSQFVGEDKTVLNNYIKITELQSIEEIDIPPQSKNLPPLQYPQNPILSLHPPHLNGQSKNESPSRNKPIGPFPLQMKITPEQTKSKLITLSGKSGNKVVQGNHQTSEFSTEKRVVEGLKPRNNVRFSYDKPQK